MAPPLRYRDTGGPGAPGGRALVLLTGFGATAEHWPAPLVSTLAARRRVLLVQNPGTGGSTADGATTTAARVAALLDDLDTGPCDVVGWSMGGMVAQALAVDRPDLVASLVLAASAPGTGDAVAPDPAALAALGSGDPAAMLGVLFPGDDEAATAYRAGFTTPPPPVGRDVLAAQAAATRSWRAGTDPAGPRTGGIAVPVLLVHGGRDTLCPPANADRLAAVLPRTRRWDRPGAGHGVLFDDPATTAATLLRLLEGSLP